MTRSSTKLAKRSPDMPFSNRALPAASAVASISFRRRLRSLLRMQVRLMAKARMSVRGAATASAWTSLLSGKSACISSHEKAKQATQTDTASAQTNRSERPCLRVGSNHKSDGLSARRWHALTAEMARRTKTYQ